MQLLSWIYSLQSHYDPFNNFVRKTDEQVDGHLYEARVSCLNVFEVQMRVLLEIVYYSEAQSFSEPQLPP
jgi:hypothetical protein